MKCQNSTLLKEIKHIRHRNFKVTSYFSFASFKNSNNIYKFYIHYVKAKDTIQSVEHLDGRLGPAAAAGSCFEGCSTRSAVKSCEGVWRCVGAGTETVGATAPFGAKCNQGARHLHKCRLSLYQS